MDFILRKIENKLSLYDPETYDYVTLLRLRIEYSLFLCLGFLWNNLDKLTQDERTKIFANLNNMPIGSAVAAITKLDCGQIKLLKGNINKVIDKYPAVRNSKMEHGYAKADSIVPELIPIYDDLVEKISILKNECDIIVVKNYNAQSNIYNGIRLPSDRNGEGVRWSCPGDIFETPEKNFPEHIFYIRISIIKLHPLFL